MKTLSDNRWEDIRPLHEEGLSAWSISKKLNLHCEIVRRVLRRNGCEPNGKKGKIKQLEVAKGHRKNMFEDILQKNGFVGDWSMGYLKTEEATIVIKNIEKEGDKFEDLMERLYLFSPEDVKLKLKEYKDPHLLILDPADPHLGKLALSEETGEEYNVDIAISRVLEGVQGLLEKASKYELEQIVLIIGNDILHYDTPDRRTTSGTPQDTCGQWWSIFNLAFELYIKVITSLSYVAPVRVVYNPSNHDYQMGYGLSKAVQAWFRNSKNVAFDIDIRDKDSSIKHRKYFQYGDNLIGTSHGDGAKEKDTPLLMAHEEPKMWGNTTYRYLYLHHIHHKKKINYQTAKDYIGTTVEYLRSPSSPDGWHHRNGYLAPKAMEGFLHHPKYGQTARLTHYF